jgi:pimeloyl-ACP methyl ester carboxylesterase
MKTYLKILTGLGLCSMMISCAHISRPDFKPGSKFHYDEEKYLNYRTIGSGSKKLIMLHGFASSSRTWDDILPLIKDFDGEIIMFDLIGYGFSSKDADDYSLKANAEIISKFIESHKIKDYIIAGHSFGGGVALMTTLNQLDSEYKPGGLVLIDSAAYKVELPFFVYYLRFPVIAPLMLKLISPEFQAEFTLKKLFYFDYRVTDERIGRYAFFVEMEGHNNTLLECADQIIPEKHEYYTSRYKNIDIPTLIIWGEDDNALKISSAYRLKKDLRKSTLKVIKKCGHLPQEEHPKPTAEAINHFINSLKKE